VQRFTFFLLIAGLAVGGCARAPRERANVLSDSAAAAIALDRPERPIVPLGGGDTLRLERVTLERAGLEISPPPPQVAVTPAEPSPEPPAPEPGEPPAPEPADQGPADARTLLPPIARGAPTTPIAGRGGRVTLDVRVDEQGDVSDVLFVESDADSGTVRAAIEAAGAVRYHPALLGGRPVAVWTRQVLEVKRGPRR
jgi:TonB family protein